MTVLGSGMLLSGTALGGTYTTSFTNNDPLDWDRPSSGVFTGYHTAGSNDFNTHLSYMRFSAEKIANSKTLLRYHTFDFRDNYNSGFFQGYGAGTNLPDPKFDYEDNSGEGLVDEVEVVARGKDYIYPSTDYYFTAKWAKVPYGSSTGHTYLISYASQSTPPTCGTCDYNNVPGSEGAALAGVNTYNYWEFGSEAASTPNISSNDDSTTESNSAPDNGDKKSQNNEEYDKIKNKDSLNEYKTKALSIVNNANDETEYDFIVTFNNPISLESAEKHFAKYNIQPSVLYGRAVGQNGEKVTLGKFSNAPADFFAAFSKENNYEFKGIIQVEGKASGASIKEFKNNSDVFAVEVSTNDFVPMGLYWKVENYNK